MKAHTINAKQQVYIHTHTYTHTQTYTYLYHIGLEGEHFQRNAAGFCTGTPAHFVRALRRAAPLRQHPPVPPGDGQQPPSGRTQQFVPSNLNHLICNKEGSGLFPTTICTKNCRIWAFSCNGSALFPPLIIYIYTYIYIHIHTYIHTYIHIYI